MLNRSNLHTYQNSSINLVKKSPKHALFLDMGLGKTTTSLTIASDMLKDFFVDNILVVAPLRVANTVWHAEALKWSHLKDLTVKVCTGSEKQRLEALNSKADIHVINRETIPWLVKTFKWKWDMLIVDESSSFKSAKANRFKALKKITKHLTSVILLSGTPSPNSMLDLWSQIYLLDNGQRLGRTMTAYKQRFFISEGYGGYTYKLRPGAKEEIMSLIKDICITMEAKDYLELPDRISALEYIELDKDTKAQYKELEKEFLLTINEVDIESPSAATLANKLLQICNGCIYDADRNIHELHDFKLNSLKEIIEDNPNENFLVAYNYKSDLKRIRENFPKAKVLSKSGVELDEWNKGNIKMLLAHPKSAGHGLNAQWGGCNIVWFGLTWSLEEYQQFNARLHRQGQTKPVTITHIVAKGCLDEKVMKALASKAKTQQELIDYLKFNK